MNLRNIKKNDAIDYIWQYSKYYGEKIWDCERLYESKNGFAALILLFNIAENIFKSRNQDYESNFFDTVKKLHDNGIINKKEYNFLSGSNISIRKIRNLFAHENLIKYNIIFKAEESGVLYPLTENDTCLKLYESLSLILILLILKVVSINFTESYNENLDNYINEIQFEIVSLKSEQLFKLKGFSDSDIEPLSSLSEIERLRIMQNSSDLNMISQIFKNIVKYSRK